MSRRRSLRRRLLSQNLGEFIEAIISPCFLIHYLPMTNSRSNKEDRYHHIHDTQG